MCGISGYFGPKDLTPEQIAVTLAGMQHRGPDGQGHLRIECGENILHLLHTRLAIIDPLERSDQPFPGCGLSSDFQWRDL